MTQDIIEMARSVNINRFRVKNLQAFANLVAAKEREACAKVCESHGETLANGAMLAAAIRARGEQA